MQPNEHTRTDAIGAAPHILVVNEGPRIASSFRARWLPQASAAKRRRRRSARSAGSSTRISTSS